MNDYSIIKKHGWLARVVPASEYDGVHANYHTHGLKTTYNHMDLQIVFPMDPRLAHQIFTVIIENIKLGKQYVDGERYDDVITNYDVQIKEYEESGRKVLRIILPDTKGLYPDDLECDEIYRSQIHNYFFG